MKTAEIFAIRCALADLIGAYQAYKQGDIHAHDWRAHGQSIDELSEVLKNQIGDEAFDELGLGLDEDEEEDLAGTAERIDILLNDGINE